MKLFFCALLGLAHATQPSNDYIKVKFLGAVINDAQPGVDAPATCSTGTVSNVFIVRVPKTTVTAAQITADHAGYAAGNDLVGACMNVSAAGTLVMGAVAKASSFSFTKTSTSKKYIVVLNNKPFCTGVHDVTAGGTAANITGFQFDADNYACGGAFSNTPANNDDGLIVVGTKGYLARGMLYTGKKVLALNLLGPYTNAACHTAAADRMNSYSVVIPLETSATGTSTDVHTTIGNTTQCAMDLGNSTTAGTHSVVSYQTTANKGEILLTMAHGTDLTSYNDTTNACTVNTDVDGQYNSLLYKVGIRGNLENCIQAATTEGGDPATNASSRYFQVVVHPDSLGYFPNEIAYPSAGTSDCTASPASSLHMSAFMAAAIAVMALFQ